MMATGNLLRVRRASIRFSLLMLFMITVDADNWIRKATTETKDTQHYRRSEDLEIARGIRNILHPVQLSKTDDNTITIGHSDKLVNIVLPHSDNSRSRDSIFHTDSYIIRDNKDSKTQEQNRAKFYSETQDRDPTRFDISELRRLVRESITFDRIKNNAVDSEQQESNNIDDKTTTATPIVLEQQVNSLQQQQQSSLNLNMMFPPHVTVIISSPKGSSKISIINVPLEADMTVYDALISASRNYPQVYPARKDNPFQLVLDYNKKLDCLTSLSAAGVNSRHKNVWIFSVRDLDDEMIYRGQCLPGDDVILRPSSILQLTYESLRSKKLIYSGKCRS